MLTAEAKVEVEVHVSAETVAQAQDTTHHGHGADQRVEESENGGDGSWVAICIVLMQKRVNLLRRVSGWRLLGSYMLSAGDHGSEPCTYESNDAEEEEFDAPAGGNLG
jgi:hypothetical protein